eukprot:TRINITY_DN66555_c8_g2_i1.p1 TRINITY_DN66555_c8_g2~~TRINITY_DN66555_c8_g2_i1.p1  ORF type:complete len:763 (-),score=88.55 TRINITY_DN66555_c8_g2_i1:1155-3443(-)
MYDYWGATHTLVLLCVVVPVWTLGNGWKQKVASFPATETASGRFFAGSRTGSANLYHNAASKVLRIGDDTGTRWITQQGTYLQPPGSQSCYFSNSVNYDTVTPTYTSGLVYIGQFKLTSPVSATADMYAGAISFLMEPNKTNPLILGFVTFTASGYTLIWLDTTSNQAPQASLLTAPTNCITGAPPAQAAATKPPLTGFPLNSQFQSTGTSTQIMKNQQIQTVKTRTATLYNNPTGNQNTASGTVGNLMTLFSREQPGGSDFMYITATNGVGTIQSNFWEPGCSQNTQYVFSSLSSAFGDFGSVTLNNTESPRESGLKRIFVGLIGNVGTWMFTTTSGGIETMLFTPNTLFAKQNANTVPNIDQWTMTSTTTVPTLAQVQPVLQKIAKCPQLQNLDVTLRTNFPKLAALLSTSGISLATLLGSTATPNGFTLFAPTDAAVDTIPQSIRSNKNILTQLLRYHVANRQYTVANLQAAAGTSQSTITSLTGSPISISTTGSARQVVLNNGQAVVTTPNDLLFSSNSNGAGRIHAVTALLRAPITFTCTVNTDCNDNDPCTTDSCVANACVFQNQAGCIPATNSATTTNTNTGTNGNTNTATVQASPVGGLTVTGSACTLNTQCKDRRSCTTDRCINGRCTNNRISASCDDGTDDDIDADDDDWSDDYWWVPLLVGLLLLVLLGLALIFCWSRRNRSDYQMYDYGYNQHAAYPPPHMRPPVAFPPPAAYTPHPKALPGLTYANTFPPPLPLSQGQFAGSWSPPAYY